MGAGHKFLAGMEEVRRIPQGKEHAVLNGQESTYTTLKGRKILLGKVPSGRQSAVTGYNMAGFNAALEVEVPRYA